MTLIFRPVDLTSVDDVVTAMCNRLDTADLNGGNARPDKQMAAYLKIRQAQNPNYISFAVDDDEIVGQLELMNGKSADAGYINLVYVVESRRGQGLGRELLKWTETLFVKSGFKRAQLTSWESNAENTAFYNKLGWNCLGPRHDVAGFLTWEKRLAHA